MLSPLNGPVPASIMFVAEAPGRLGAYKTRVPLLGDATGRNFDMLLSGCALARGEVFLTNCVLCNPRDDRGRNRKPTPEEIRTCVSQFLPALISLVDPILVVSLGTSALAALGWMEHHGLSLADVGTVSAWSGRLLAPLYHPSPRVVNTRRSLDQQVRDLRSALDRAIMTGASF